MATKQFTVNATFVSEGGKVSRDTVGTARAFADHIRVSGEEWIAEHTGDRMTAEGTVTVSYNYDLGTATSTARQRRRLRRAV